jgi:hypothetical protein
MPANCPRYDLGRLHASDATAAGVALAEDHRAIIDRAALRLYQADLEQSRRSDNTCTAAVRW